MTLDDDLLTRTKDLWERYYARPLSDEDVREIASNVAAFFTLLLAWDQPHAGARDEAADRRRHDDAVA